MDEDQIADLKQFIASLIAQQTSTIRQEVRSDLLAEIKKLDKKTDRIEKR